VFWHRDCAVQVQSVLFNNKVADISRAVAALSRAVELAHTDGDLGTVVLRLGDCSSLPVLDERSLEMLRVEAMGTMQVSYDFFGENLGTACGHNRLASAAEDRADFLWIQNPDVIVTPRLFSLVLGPFRRSGVGQVEAKQIPIEHPKEYDATTGETEWTTTACVMTPMAVFREVGGFDAESFFMYCDDVDLALRIRQLGYRLIFQPAAACFHDKRLLDDGTWNPTWAEQYYSAEAGLIMLHKWSYPELLEETLSFFQASSDPKLERAAKNFLERREHGALPVPQDPQHEVARFDGRYYGKHRFPL
jgi:GT2 family glycosyltransferase